VTDDTSHRVTALESLADLTCDGRSPRETTGCSVRRTPSGKRIAEARLNIHHADYEASVAVVRNASGDEDFQSAWAEGAALSVEESSSCCGMPPSRRCRPALKRRDRAVH